MCWCRADHPRSRQRAVRPGRRQRGRADGRPLTPALFGGITEIGIEEVSGEASTVDSTLKIGEQPLRPEFDVTLAYNPASVLIPVARLDGIGFTALGAATGGGFVAGQGGVMRLDGSADPLGRALFLRLGSAAVELTGQSRAAQWMLLQQMVDEARGQVAADSPHALLTPAGRRTLSRLAGHGRIVVEVDRAADIRQLLRWAAREKVKIAIAGGSEAWQLAPELAAQVPVFVDVLSNLPASFDQIGATLENAARLQRSGVAVSFVQRGDASHNARKMRQLAGNAVANGLPWADGLAGLTRVPAQAFGVADQIGSIEPGKRADLVLWEGDPLDVAHYAEQVWLGGRAMRCARARPNCATATCSATRSPDLVIQETAWHPALVLRLRLALFLPALAEAEAATPVRTDPDRADRLRCRAASPGQPRAGRDSGQAPLHVPPAAVDCAGRRNTAAVPAGPPVQPVVCPAAVPAAGGSVQAVDVLFDWIWRDGNAADSAEALREPAARLGIEDVASAIAAPRSGAAAEEHRGRHCCRRVRRTDPGHR